MSLRTGIDDGPPLPSRSIAAWRDPEIIKMREQGCSFRMIAKQFKMSHEGVRAILIKNGIR